MSNVFFGKQSHATSPPLLSRSESRIDFLSESIRELASGIYSCEDADLKAQMEELIRDMDSKIDLEKDSVPELLLSKRPTPLVGMKHIPKPRKVLVTSRSRRLS